MGINNRVALVSLGHSCAFILSDTVQLQDHLLLQDSHIIGMAIRALESRLERMSVNDENEPMNGGSMYLKPKVSVGFFFDHCL